MVPFGEAKSTRAPREFTEHYHSERNHQGLGSELIERVPLSEAGTVGVGERLGGRLESRAYQECRPRPQSPRG